MVEIKRLKKLLKPSHRWSPSTLIKCKFLFLVLLLFSHLSEAKTDATNTPLNNSIGNSKRSNDNQDNDEEKNNDENNSEDKIQIKFPSIQALNHQSDPAKGEAKNGPAWTSDANDASDDSKDDSKEERRNTSGPSHNGGWGHGHSGPGPSGWGGRNPSGPSDNWGRGGNRSSGSGRRSSSNDDETLSVDDPGPSHFPDLTCPLLDTEHNQEILDAIENLNQALRPTEVCKGSVDLDNINTESKNLKESMSNISSLFQAGGTAASPDGGDPLDWTSTQDMDEHIKEAVNSLANIGNSLRKNSFLRSTCGKSLLSSGQILSSLSELTSSIAPFALLAAAANPALRTYVPFILGGTALLTTARVINEIFQREDIPIHEPQVRATVIKNICEFSKVNYRMELLLKGNELPILKSTESLKDYKKSLRKKLFDSVPEFLRNPLDARNKLTEKLNLYQKDHVLSTNILKEINTSKEENCSKVEKIVPSAHLSSEFPGISIIHYKDLVENVQVSPVRNQKKIIDNELEYRKDLLKYFTDRKVDRSFDCNKKSKKYFEALSTLLKDYGNTIRALKISLNKEMTELNQYPVYKQFTLEEKKQELVFKELDNVRAVKEAMEDSTQGTNPIQLSEIIKQVKDLKMILFTNITPSRSAAYSLIYYYHGLFQNSLSSFNKGWSTIKTYVEPANFFSRLRPELKESYQVFNYYTKLYQERAKDHFDGEIQYAFLDDLTLDNFPEKEADHKALCRDIRTTWQNWSSAISHRETEKFLCLQIEQHLDYASEPALNQHCIGNRTSKNRRLSVLEETESSLTSQYKKRVGYVYNKSKELMCVQNEILPFPTTTTD